MLEDLLRQFTTLVFNRARDHKHNQHQNKYNMTTSKSVSSSIIKSV